jgi:hypothetical protein
MWSSTALCFIFYFAFQNFESTSAALMVVDNFSIIAVPGWSNGSCTLTNDTGVQMFGITMNLFRRLNHKIMVLYIR